MLTEKFSQKGTVSLVSFVYLVYLDYVGPQL